ncbi:hypothetical protein D3C83_27070 [compost metagenome]
MSLPALITLALPDTGAASSFTPFSLSFARISADSSSEIEVLSTTIFGILPFEPTPFAPNSTSFTSLPVETIVNTMSQPARSASESTTFAPDFASGSAFARVRFHTEMSHPAFASRSAIA